MATDLDMNFEEMSQSARMQLDRCQQW